MKKISKLILTVLFASALWVQAFHRHSAHEGGLAAPHTDCVVCGWSRGSHVPYAWAAAGFNGSGVSERSPAALWDESFPHQTFSSPLSRAPPAA